MKKEDGVTMNGVDPLQQLIAQGMRREEGQSYIWSLFRGELSGKNRQNIKEIVLLGLLDIFETVKRVGVERTMELYSNLKPHSPSVLSLTSKAEREALLYLANLIPGEEELAEELLSPLLSNMDSITWNKLVAFSLLAQEYNLEWALAAYDWGEEEVTGQEHMGNI